MTTLWDLRPVWLKQRSRSNGSTKTERSSDADAERGLSNTPSPNVFDGSRGKASAAEIRLVRKLDWRILPMMWVMYWLNYIDRSNITSARLDHIEQHLGVSSTQWQTGISMLFVGYVLMQIPSNMLMASGWIRPSMYMGLCMCLWAIVSACTALVTNYTGLVLIRLALGVTEAPFFAGALFTLSSFYTRREIAFRISILYSANIIAMATSGPIAAGVFKNLGGARGIHGWQWLFIIEGSITFAAGILGAVILPDTPSTTKWLTYEERVLAAKRIEDDTVGLVENEGFGKTFKELCVNKELLLFVLLQMMHLSSVGFNNYFPSIIRTLGYNKEMTLYLTCPPFFLAAIISFGTGLLSGKLNERTFIITTSMVVAMIGFALCGAVENPSVRYVGAFLFTSGGYAVNCVILGWVGATLGKTPQQKAIAYGMVNTFANLSYVYSSFLYKKETEPQYAMAMYTNIGFCSVVIVCAQVLRWRLRRANAKMDREEVVVVEGAKPGAPAPKKLRYCY